MLSKPIFFRKRAYSAQKSFFAGTHRILSPEETWEKIAPLAKKIGVTRVSNITGLDRVGIPVTLAIRPGTQTLVTSSGKGISYISALVSGLMEALEIYCAEETELPFLHLSYNELIKQFPAPDLSDFHYRKASLFHPDWKERWSLGWDLVRQEEFAVPTLCVTMNPRFNAREKTELFSFTMSTNGLASGNHFLEAVAAGMYELIERDAITCHQYAGDTTSFHSPRVRLETIPYPSVRNILEKFKEASIEPLLYDCSVDTGVPVFMASIYDQKLTHVGVIKGYGAHLDPEVAMIRALTEAAQGRVVLIAGSRDDIFTSHIELFKKHDSQSTRDTFTSVPETCNASCYQTETTDSLEGDIHLLISKLAKVGLARVVVHDLTKKELGIPVARVIIPGLEDYYSDETLIGKRAKAFAASQSLHFKENVFSSQKAAHFPAGVL